LCFDNFICTVIKTGNPLLLQGAVSDQVETTSDYEDEQWGRQLEHELELAKKRYLQSLLNDAKRKQPTSVLKDEKKNGGIVANMAKRATRKKR